MISDCQNPEFKILYCHILNKGFWIAKILNSRFWTAKILNSRFWTAKILNSRFWRSKILYSRFWTAKILHSRWTKQAISRTIKEILHSRKINGKCTHGTNRRSRVWPVYFIYIIAILFSQSPVLHRARYT